MADQRITLFHAPDSRSTGTPILLEELEADCELEVPDLARDAQ